MNHHRSSCALLVAVLCFGTLAGCGTPATPSASPDLVDATLAFGIAGGMDDERRALTKQVTAFLAVEKEGRTTLVDAWQDEAPEGTRYARHNFPPGTTAVAMAGYYWALLTNTGWREGTDFEYDKEHGVLRFLSVTRIAAGADSEEVEAVVIQIPAKAR